MSLWWERPLKFPNLPNPDRLKTSQCHNDVRKAVYTVGRLNENALTAFRTLRDDKDFADVTLTLTISG